ncbi:hypothetical protein F511_09646 [Dorcoceras hygrometricum]|uniref:Uncharacterized protein n=1 Tax=Dorcoceras hygrometricum TaxID=472368 RepID=A0A2Z7DA97_9LAMI|nr:hypothetical protein F511_09646 [Dorcoceras hygrometricum]
MAASLSINFMQVNIESMLAMEHIGMVRMFKSLEEIGLSGGIRFSLTKDVFAEAFGIPTEGRVGFLDIPTKTVAEMRVRFSGTEAPFRAPNNKKEMKMEYRLLHDIVAKALCAKAGSIDVVTSEKFDLMVAISAGLKNLVKTDLGESVKLHPLKVLNNKSVHTYMKKNLGVGPAGETSKVSGATASEQQCTTDSLQSLTKKPDKEAGETKKSAKAAVEKKKKKEEKVVSVVVKKPVEARSQAAPVKSKSGTSSDADSCPTDADASTVNAPEVNMETNPEVERQADETSTAADQEDHMECTDKTETEAQTIDKEQSIVVRSDPVHTAQQPITSASKSVHAPVKIREINWVTHFLPKIDPAAKGKELLQTWTDQTP